MVSTPAAIQLLIFEHIRIIFEARFYWQNLFGRLVMSKWFTPLAFPFVQMFLTQIKSMRLSSCVVIVRLLFHRSLFLLYQYKIYLVFISLWSVQCCVSRYLVPASKNLLSFFFVGKYRNATKSRTKVPNTADHVFYLICVIHFEWFRLRRQSSCWFLSTYGSYLKHRNNYENDGFRLIMSRIICLFNKQGEYLAAPYDFTSK